MRMNKTLVNLRAHISAGPRTSAEYFKDLSIGESERIPLNVESLSDIDSILRSNIEEVGVFTIEEYFLSCYISFHSKYRFVMEDLKPECKTVTP